MKICFYGVGGVGGFFGSRIVHQLGTEHSIYFIARGKHLEAIRKNGLTLKSADSNDTIVVMPDKCTDSVDELPICDLIILSVKSYDLPFAVKEIAKITNKGTIVLPLLNGVDIYERIREHLNTGIVLQACVYVGTHIESPGIIYQKGGSCKIFIGNDPLFPSIWAETILSILDDSLINYEWTDSVHVSIWSKFMFIAAYGLVAATYNKTLGAILESHHLSDLVKAIMKETESIARKLSIPLEKNIVESSFQKAKQFPFETKTSFQRDVESKGKINEGDLFGGTLIRYGDKLDISTSNTQMVYNALLNKLG